MKKVLSMIMCVVMVLSLCTVTLISANATEKDLAEEGVSKSADEAIAWVKSQIGRALDYDGEYGAQCVDLIMFYYQYLGVSPVGGNGGDYSWNSLPSGWQRLQGAQPQKGDILVYVGDTYGHVGIYESDRVTYHQNVNGNQTVQQYSYLYNSFSPPYWGVIRPNFNSVSSPPVFSINEVSGISETNAYISCSKITNPSNGTMTRVGFQMGTSSYNYTMGSYDDLPSWTSNWISCDYKMSDCNITLSPGTKYYYRFYIVISGNTYYSEEKSFSTGSPAVPVFSINDVSDISETNAYIACSKITNPNNGVMTKVGFQMGTASYNYTLGSYDDLPSWTSNWISCDYKMSDCNITLTPGTKYYYRFYIVISGNTYYSEEKSFTTTQRVLGILGDTDGDETVTILDATIVQKKLASLPVVAFIEMAADADEDGIVTIIDATAIQKYLAALPTNQNIGKPIS